MFSRVSFSRVRVFGHPLGLVVSGLLLAFLAMATPVAAQPGVAEGEIPEFSGKQAFAWLEAQCAIGPRTPGSPGNIQLRQTILDLAQAKGLQATPLCFTATDPMTGQAVELCNLVVSAGTNMGNALWLGAHFDTRPICDKDPDPEKRDQPLVGANDGASGVAVLMHLMELMSQNPPARRVDLLFLDGEDSGSSGKPHEFCLGSAHLARTWQDFGSPLAGANPTGVIILDMIGDSDLAIPMEQYSAHYSAPLLEMVFERAELLGLDAFIREPGPPVYDDHIPFIQAGLPAIDLIDFDYPLWHTTADVPAACSAHSLAQVGTLMVDLIYNP